MEVKQWLQPWLILPNLTEKFIFLGFFDNQSNRVIINHLILLFKNFLYENRQNNFKISVTLLQLYVSYVYAIENKIAKSVKKLKLICVIGRRLQISYHVDKTHESIQALCIEISHCQ